MLVASGTLTRAGLGRRFAISLARVFFPHTALACINVDSFADKGLVHLVHVSHYDADYPGPKGGRRRRSTGSTYLDISPMPSDDQHTLSCGGGAYSADAAGTARVSQEHRCVPHRGTADAAPRGSVDGFKLMTLHLYLLRR